DSVLSFFFSSRRRHTRSKRDWSSDVCSSDLDTISLETIEKAFTENRHRELLLPMVKGLKHLDTLYVDESTKKKVLFGQKLPKPREQLTTNPFKVMHGDQLLAVYQ